MLIKDFSVKVKAGPDDGLQEGQFTAYASVFGNIDSYGDMVVKGAFTDTLAEWAESDLVLPVLYGHNLADPDYNIGGADGEQDDHGLLIHGQLDLEAPKAMQVYRLLKGRRINQMSFAYDVLESTPGEQDGVKYTELRKLKLYEVSIVPIGANQETEVLAVKSLSSALLSKAGRVLSAKNEEQIRSIRDQLKDAAGSLDEVLSSVHRDDEEKASSTGPVKASTPEVPAEEPSRTGPPNHEVAYSKLLSVL